MFKEKLIPLSLSGWKAKDQVSTLTHKGQKKSAQLTLLHIFYDGDFRASVKHTTACC